MINSNFKRKGTDRQTDYIFLYNKLHSIFQDKARPYYEQVAEGIVYDKFIDIEEAQHALDTDFIPFMKAVHIVKINNNFVKSKITDFKKINELRNYITHKDNIIEIAEPTDYAINLLEDTLAKIEKPMTVESYLNRFNKKDVELVDIKTPVLPLFEKIQKYNYTQFPVFEGNEFKGIVSDNGITYWFVNTALNEKDYETIELSDVTVGDLLQVEENSTAFKLVGKDVLLYDALKEFEISEKQSVPPILLIIDRDEIDSSTSIIGVLTAHDYLNMSQLAL